MNKKVLELLNNQEEARNVLALEIIEEAREALILLGKESYLDAKSSAVKEVEIIKEVEVVKEVPVEIIKEVEVIKEIEVIKEVPVEVIKEVTVEKEAVIDGAMISKLEEKVKEVEMLKRKINSLNEKIKGLEAKESMYKSVITNLNAKINDAANNKVSNSNAKQYKTQLVDTGNNDLSLVKNCGDTFIKGYFKGVAFEAAVKIEGTTIYDPTKWELKDELNKVLVEQKLIYPNRQVKDKHRVECELGCCHQADPNKYLGYAVVNGSVYNFVYNVKFNNNTGVPAVTKNESYLAGKSNFSPCKDADVIAVIKELIARHNDNMNAYIKAHSQKPADLFKATNNSGEDNINNKSEEKNVEIQTPDMSLDNSTNTNNSVSEIIKEDKKGGSEYSDDMFDLDDLYEM